VETTIKYATPSHSLQGSWPYASPSEFLESFLDSRNEFTGIDPPKIYSQTADFLSDLLPAFSRPEFEDDVCDLPHHRFVSSEFHGVQQLYGTLLYSHSGEHPGLLLL